MRQAVRAPVEQHKRAKRRRGSPLVNISVSVAGDATIATQLCLKRLENGQRLFPAGVVGLVVARDKEHRLELLQPAPEKGHQIVLVRLDVANVAQQG